MLSVTPVGEGAAAEQAEQPTVRRGSIGEEEAAVVIVGGSWPAQAVGGPVDGAHRTLP